MFEKVNKIEPTQNEEHLKLATEMANVLIERFDPMFQNEAVHRIYAILKEHRLSLIDEARKRIDEVTETYEYLKNSYSNL